MAMIGTTVSGHKTILQSDNFYALMSRGFTASFFDVTHSGALHEVSAGQDMYVNLARVVADVSAGIAVNNGFAFSQEWSVLYKAAELGRTWD